MGDREVVTPEAPAPGGSYSQGVIAGDFIFTAGFGPGDPGTGEVRGSTVYEQTRFALENVAAVLASAGASLGDVVKVTSHLSDLADFEEYDRAFASAFSKPFPARTTVGSRLAGILVEIDVVARVPNPCAHGGSSGRRTA
ncbi:RidA family protein [Microbacterium sp.]|uniref:RidA family protein n=1 Tax=Microbacterium sp. TaxID=51671 RepID=UPI00092C661D|nr:Rid family hydrolase [Microbacterium sp.]MBN9193030.1 RidA family protein [Microbacterium sp.]OJU61366.1 MAG: reactive intermediate/imine deaminase [Microbacterium sp. 70-38]